MEIDYLTVLNIVDDFIRSLKTKKKDIECSYEIIGYEEEQAKNWWTKELLWEDDEQTIPKHNPVYAWIPKETLTDEEQRQLYTIAKLEKEIMKLIGKVAG